MTYRPTCQPTYRQTDRSGNREVTLPINAKQEPHIQETDEKVTKTLKKNAEKWQKNTDNNLE